MTAALRLRATATLLALASAAAPGAAQKWCDAKSDGAFMARVRGLVVVPHGSLSTPAIPGADVSISTSVAPELDLTHFFTGNIAAESILALTPHDVDGRARWRGRISARRCCCRRR